MGRDQYLKGRMWKRRVAGGGLRGSGLRNIGKGSGCGLEAKSQSVVSLVGGY